MLAFYIQMISSSTPGDISADTGYSMKPSVQLEATVKSLAGNTKLDHNGARII